MVGSRYVHVFSYGNCQMVNDLKYLETKSSACFKQLKFENIYFACRARLDGIDFPITKRAATFSCISSIPLSRTLGGFQTTHAYFRTYLTYVLYGNCWVSILNFLAINRGIIKFYKPCPPRNENGDAI